MWKWLNGIVLFLSAVVFISAAEAAPTTASCLDCHSTMSGPLEKAPGVTIDPNVDKDKFTNSIHGGFECVQCHMGIEGYPHTRIPAKVDKTVKNLALKLTAKSKVDPVAQAACVQCHPDVYAAYEKSVHGQNVMVKKSSDGPVCTSCHGSPHYLQPKTNEQSKVYLFNVVRACGTCHEEKHLAEKYGFSSHVMERYLESFHGRKLKLGHPGAPSCASCHGAHDIKKSSDPASPVSAQNKIKTCAAAECHPGATAKFAASYTHKPMHPIAHYAELGLIILTVSTFLGIIVHVLLDVYAEIRDRLFRKGGSHD